MACDRDRACDALATCLKISIIWNHFVIARFCDGSSSRLTHEKHHASEEARCASGDSAGHQATADAATLGGDLRIDPRRHLAPSWRSGCRTSLDEPRLRTGGHLAACAIPLFPEQVRHHQGTRRAPDEAAEPGVPCVA